MSNQLQTLKTFIKEKRPSLNKQSISTYASILSNLHKNVYPDDKFDINDFEYSEDMLNYLKQIPARKRKTTLSALVVITDLPEYRNQMLEDIETYNNEEDKQVKSIKQRNSWVTTQDIQTIYDRLKEVATHVYKKKTMTDTDLQLIQNYIILSLLGGVFIPPRRSKDYVEFKIRNVNKDVDNYMTKTHFIFNNYKTAKTYGQQQVEIPKPLKSIINKWLKINPTEYLLFDTNFNKLSNVKMTQRLNKLFNNNVSVNQLRHTYLTDKYSEVSKSVNKMKSDMSMMGTSVLQENIYIKH